jgi:hypothetical protein
MNGINLVDLEKLTETLYGKQQDPSITEYSKLLVENYIKNYQKFEELLQFFINTNSQHCQFWLLHLLVEVVDANHMNFSTQEREQFRKYLMLLFTDYIGKITQQTFISNKFGLLLITWIKIDYPENWPTLFKDLLTAIFNSTDDAKKIAQISKLNLTLGMFIDMMLIFDDEFIKFRNTQSEFDMIRATIVKDNMRVDIITDIIGVFTQLMQSHESLNKKVVKNAIKIIGQLIDWNNISLFNEPINLIMGNLISNADFQSECFEVLSSLVGKGMEPEHKLEVIRYLNINTLLEGILKYDNINENTMYNICEIVTQMGNFTIEYFAMLKANKSGYESLLTQVIEVVNYCVYHTIKIIESTTKNFEYKTAVQLHDFITEITGFLKTNNNICNLLVISF